MGAAMPIQRVIHRSNPYAASRTADEAGRRDAANKPERTKYYAAREVMNRDGTFPFGEGFLYEKPGAGPTNAGKGTPGAFAVAGHRGSKRQQQDAFAAARFTVSGHAVTALTVADGVSASGSLAKPASARATSVFLERLQQELTSLPKSEASRHVAVEKAMEKAAFAANFEVVRQVLLDRKGDGAYDAGDRQALKRALGVDLPTGALTDAQMRKLAPKLEAAIAALDETGRAALTTFSASVAVDNDLYTFSSGDAVVGLHRPTEPAGHRFVHLTHRDQEVVELFRKDRDGWRAKGDVFENVITDSFGDSASLQGTFRRYPNLLEPGDRVVVLSDGVGPRARQGLDRRGIERVLDANPTAAAASKAMAKAQAAGRKPGEYQDNIGIAVLDVD